MNDLDPLAPIFVSGHALGRAQERLRYPIPAAEVRAEVRVAVMADRVATVRPDWTRGDGNNRPRDVETGARYVWDASATRCWVVQPSARRIDVKTLLISGDAEAAAAERLHLRRR